MGGADLRLDERRLAFTSTHVAVLAYKRSYWRSATTQPRLSSPTGLHKLRALCTHTTQYRLKDVDNNEEITVYERATDIEEDATK